MFAHKVMLNGKGKSRIRKGGVALMEGFCLKCRQKREVKNAEQVVLKNGRPATQGSCPVCGTKITVIGKS